MHKVLTFLQDLLLKTKIKTETFSSRPRPRPRPEVSRPRPRPRPQLLQPRPRPRPQKLVSRRDLASRPHITWNNNTKLNYFCYCMITLTTAYHIKMIKIITRILLFWCYLHTHIHFWHTVGLILYFIKYILCHLFNCLFYFTYHYAVIFILFFQQFGVKTIWHFEYNTLLVKLTETPLLTLCYRLSHKFVHRFQIAITLKLLHICKTELKLVEETK